MNSVDSTGNVAGVPAAQPPTAKPPKATRLRLKPLVLTLAILLAMVAISVWAPVRPENAV